MRRTIYLYLILGFIGMSACTDDDLDPTTSTSIDVDNISSANDLEAVALGMYDRMSDYRYYGRNFLLYGDLRSDNTYSTSFYEVASMTMAYNSEFAYYTWLYMYQTIAYANIVINANLTAIDGDESAINYYKGQAYAIRALVHFDLMKLYGQEHAGGKLAVPYVKEYASSNTDPARDSLDVFKEYIESDFESALELISEDYTTKAYITKAAVYGLQSRYYLYTKQWEKARDAAKNVISEDQFSIVSGNNYINSWSTDEAANSIFELAYSSTDKIYYENIGSVYYGEYDNVRVLEDLYDLFEDGDIRKDESMLVYYETDGECRNVGKYPSVTGETNICLLRYEEVILNYVEALWRLNNSDSEALTYLNMIPENRGASSYSEINEDNILLERRKELAFEGFRFYDLVRTGRNIPYVDSRQVYSTSGITYGSYNLAFPIPENEINANSNMEQNDGY